jgi:hypothetical protein
MAQSGSTYVDAKSNIFGYGVGTPAPGGGGGGLVAFTIDLTGGTGRVATFAATGSAWWMGPGGPNGPDGGFFSSNTNIPALGPISGFSIPRSGHLVGLFLEAGDPTGMSAPAAFSYPNAASLTAPVFAPLIRQVFFIGDGLTDTGSGLVQQFHVPDSATKLVLGIADAAGFNGLVGQYNDNVGGYQVGFNVVPSPSSILLAGVAMTAMRRRR